MHKTTPDLETSSVTLRPAQKAILNYNQGKMGVSAVPGSGKTFTIEQLVLKLIGAGTSPQRIGIATYMRSTRASLSARLQSQLSQKQIYGRVEVFTLHSLSLRILRELQPGFSQVAILEQYEQERIINTIVNQWMRVEEKTWKSWLPGENTNKMKHTRTKLRKEIFDTTKTLIGFAKNKRIRPQKFPLNSSPVLSWVLEFYALYQQYLDQKGKIDYDDLGWRAVDLLEREASARSIAQDWFMYLFEDEAQDSSPLQERLLEILSDRWGNLVRVGDPNQSILSTFSNADPLLFRRFCQRKEHTLHTLIEANRSAPKIIALANYLVDWVNFHHPDPRLRSALERQHIVPATTGVPNPDDREADITFRRISGEMEGEQTTIAELACAAIETYPEHSVAILVQTNDQGSAVLEEVQKLGGKYIDLLRSNTSGRQFIEVLLNVTQFFADPVRPGIICQTFEALCPYFAIPSSQAIVVSNALSQSLPEDILYPLLGQPIALPPIADLDPLLHKKSLEILRHLATWLSQSNLPWDELLRIIVQHLQRSVEDLYVGNYLIKQLEQVLRTHFLAEWIDIAGEIKGILERPLLNLPAEIRSYKPEPGTITVLTIHRSKGLEWDEVFVIGCSAYHFPASMTERTVGVAFQGSFLYLQAEVLHQLKELSGEVPIDLTPAEDYFLELAAERLRLLYVAITRAKRRITLSVATHFRGSESRSALVFDKLEAFHLSTLSTSV